MNTLVKEINKLIDNKSLLKHPFYQLWSDGKLSKEMLAGYSKEYYQIVKAVPEFVQDVTKHAPNEMLAGLKANQAEEAEHIELWENFAESLGVEKEELTEYKGLEKTNDAISDLSSLMCSLESGAVAMYAFEKDIPNISRTKLEGLDEFYSITSESGTEYFKEHIEADIRHAAAWQGILESIPEEKHDEYISVAEKSLDAQNHLLDSCYGAYC